MEQVPRLVCVTGGTGYIASWIIQQLLDRGYTVHTTARNPDDPSKVGFLWELTGSKERLKIFKADLIQEGSFDQAFNGVQAVIHVAGVVLIDPKDDPQVLAAPHCWSGLNLSFQVKLVETSIKGTLNVLSSCAKFPSITKVVMTSSCSAIRYDYDRSSSDPPLDEQCWTNPDYCAQHKLWYPLAKTLAEKQAWQFSREHGINLVVVNPSFIVGPLLQPVPTSTILLVLGMLTGYTKVYPNTVIGFVHVRDAATAHILALESPQATGRYICSERVAHWRDVLDMLRTKYPDYAIAQTCSQDRGENIPHRLDTSKIERLGLARLLPLDKMFDDCVHSLKARGFLD